MSESELHPLAAEVSQHLGETPENFLMQVHCSVQAGKDADLKQAFHQPLLETVKEEGNFTYRLLQHTDDPTKFIVIEHWRDLSSLDAHLKQPYLEKLLQDLEAILAEPPRVEVFREYVAT